MTKRFGLTLVAVTLLAGCSGGGGGAPLAPGGAGSGASAGSGPSGQVSFVLTVPRPTSQARKPQYLSTATQSVKITLGNQTSVLELGAASPQCTTPAAGSGTTATSCVATFTIAAGTYPYTIAAYDKANAAGSLLSSVTGSTTVAAGATDAVKAVLNGIVAALGVSVAPNTLAIGTASTATVDVQAFDADKRLIVGPGTYANASGQPVSIALANSDTSGATSVSPAGPYAQPTAVELAYNGKSLPSVVTLTVSAAGLPSATTTLEVLQQSAFATPNPTNPPANTQTFVQIERLSRPAVKEVTERFVDHQKSNAVEPYNDPTLKASISTYVNAFRAPAYGPTVASVLYPDEYAVDLSQPGPAAYLGVETGGATGGQFGGRDPNNDVIDASLSVLFGNTLATLGLLPDDKKENACLATENLPKPRPSQARTATFPYLNVPH